MSTSRGPVVVLKGWMDKAAVTMLLRDGGVPLSEAHDAASRILCAEIPRRFGCPAAPDMQRVRHQLDDLGVML
jgi:hypothetical protein